MTLPERSAVSRREFVRAAVAAGGASALSACVGGEGELSAPTGGDPDELPARQHAWNEHLAADDDGNLLLPEHHVLLSLELRSAVDATSRETVEAGLRELERSLEWGHEGLLFTIGYTPAYFDRFDEALAPEVDLPDPEPLTSLENPDRLELDEADALLHLASDDPAVVLAAEEAAFGDAAELNGREVRVTLDGVFERTSRRTGFVGAGLPAEEAREADLGSMPSEEEIPEDAPLFMGFRSGFSESQASEDRVTIESGPFAGGSTQHVESIRLQLRTWFDQDSHRQRVQKLFSPAHAEEDLVGAVGERLSTSSLAAQFADRTDRDAREAGVVGHAQKAARAREDGQPLLLRRDFNTTDGSFPGIHFLSLQSSISEFVRVREAMAGEDLHATGAVGRRLNNGILQYLTVLRRGNYLVPPREHRALPTPSPDQ